MSPENLVNLHQQLVEIPSISGDEQRIMDWVAEFLSAHDVGSSMIGGSLVARVSSTQPSEQQTVVFNTHLDTVPPGKGWSGNPHVVRREDDRIIGLGSNDAKGPAAAMIAATIDYHSRPNRPYNLLLTLAREEETTGKGTSEIADRIADQQIVAAVVGEPTALKVAIEQKGLLIAELVHRGTSCHAAHAQDLGVQNPIVGLAEDIVSLTSAALAEPTPELGAPTLQPTILSGGVAKNKIPAEARAMLDIRTVPSKTHEEYLKTIRGLIKGEVEVISKRLQPVSTDRASLIARCAIAALGGDESVLFGSRTMSDMVFLREHPCIKIGPGDSSRSHTPDEYILETELHRGYSFYSQLLALLADRVASENINSATT